MPADTVVTRNDTIREIVVTAQSPRQRVSDVQVGAEQLELDDLKITPALFGENDIMRSIQLLAGVKSESEASSSFQVRGGTSVQNQVLYDDAPVYNVGHLAGLFSAFNDASLSAATLYKGMIPAAFGGASSAVLDVNAKSGNRDAWHGGGTIGLLAAKASIDGPFDGGRGSVLVAARRSYLDLFMKLIPDFKDNILNFHDINAKVDYVLGSRDRVSLTFFTGYDNIRLEDMMGMKWTNLASTLRWTHRTGTHSHSQTSLYYSGYNTENGIDLLGMEQSFTGHIRQVGLRQNFHIQTGSHIVETGLQTTLLDVKSAEWQIVNNHQKEKRRSWDNNIWINANLNFGQWLKLAAGLRLDSYSSLGGTMYYGIDEEGEIIRLYKKKSNEIVKTWVNLEPRLSATLLLSPSVSIKAGYTRTTQNIHALRNQSLSTPFDRYALTSNILKPEIADQISAGVFAVTPDEMYDMSIEAYWRTISNVADYRDGKTFSSEIEIERLILAGKGRGYGIETSIRKNKGRLTGWLSYTLAWSKTRIDGINGGRWYDANNDRRHDINIVCMYQASKRWKVAATWVYNSGQAFTAPYGKYEIIDNWVYYYPERNSYRAPAYHRMDLSATWSKRTPKTGTLSQWTFSIYNAYNRYNALLIDFEDSSDGARTKAKQYSLFGILPSVAYSVYF